MAKSDTDGVWRTIGGRRVFIKEGQSLADAMKESGKFTKKEREDEFEKQINEGYKTFHGKTDEEAVKIMEKDPEKYGKEKTKASEEDVKKANEINEMLEKEKQDAYESKVYGSDVQKADEELKKTFGKDFKYKEEMEEIDKEVSQMKGDDLNDAYHSLEDTDNSYEAKAIRKEYERRGEQARKFHETTQQLKSEGSSNDESFTMTNGDKKVTISKNDEGKWEDSDGNKYMGYLSKEDVKQYFKGDWHEEKTAYEENDTFAKNEINRLNNEINKIKKGEGIYASAPDNWKQTALKEAEALKQKYSDTLQTLPERTPEEKASDLRYAKAKVMYKLTGDEKYKKEYQDEIKATTERVRKKVEAEKQAKKENSDWLRDAFNKYKKEHPNSKMTLSTFKKENKK